MNGGIGRPESRQFFGIRIERFVCSGLGSSTGNQAEPFSYRARRFLEAILESRAERTTYDLRTLICPPGESTGTIEVFVLGCLHGASKEEAAAAEHRLLRIAKAYFGEYDFVALGQAGVQRALVPFEIRSLHEIVRRSRWMDSVSDPKENGERVLHVAPFLPPEEAIERLWMQLRQSESPVLLTIRIRKTRIESKEAEVLERQAYRWDSMGASLFDRELGTDVEALPIGPSRLALAAAVGLQTEALLAALRNSCTLMAVQIASTARIASSVIHALGGHLTRSVGGDTPWHPEASLWGGYRVLDRTDDLDAREAVGSLKISLPVEIEAEQTRLPFLFDQVSAATVFQLPRLSSADPVGVDVRRWRVGRAPDRIQTEGTLLGTAISSPTEVRLELPDRMRHVYVVGRTGAGKTTLLRSMILDDIRSGAGVCVIDPHGDLFHSILGVIPRERVEDVVVIDPGDPDSSIALNPLECSDVSERYFIVQEFLEILVRLVQDQYGSEAPRDFIGPIFMQHARMNLLLVMSDPDNPGTLLEYHRLFTEQDAWKRWADKAGEDPLLQRWVEEVLPRVDYLSQGTEGVSMGSYVGSKFENFLFDPRLRRMFNVPRSTVDLRSTMDQGKILLVNLSRGLLTDANSRFLGMLLLAKLQAAAMARVLTPEAERRPFHIYVDEFQNVATQNFISLLSEGRKFGLSLVLANQFVHQLREMRIVESVIGNVGTLVAFRLGMKDAVRLEEQFHQTFDRQDLINLPNWTACISTLMGGQVTPPFSLRTVLDPVAWSEGRMEEVRAASRRKYGISSEAERSVVEKVGPKLVEPIASIDRRRRKDGRLELPDLRSDPNG